MLRLIYVDFVDLALALFILLLLFFLEHFFAVIFLFLIPLCISFKFLVVTATTLIVCTLCLHHRRLATVLFESQICDV